ncbi:hypothetical protein BO86DRAFT_96267 [Aspergillus japonicus CBS 114.51]|uniref:Fungal STAND N-terminal Goodbye domain-containing protein n=1 Tax=Aspergillus japonicus CBS 114.51 TaxID=1448312 RepID=A0A8T8X165_ASPJA|nr:hypothetical protein BO86DRAFT_96267 [Aspergillus japonicus CBS 114.51]RAH81654.1 hypothetical protein BO86DRAFT_96267 [Aspergillus japonicus CBS 114.51]
MSDKKPNPKPAAAASAPTPPTGTVADTKEPKSLDDLWKEALDRIAAENNVSLEELQTRGDQWSDAESGLQKASKLFEHSRRPGDRKDKVMKSVAGCLDWVDSGVTFVKGHVSGTYAVPAQLVAGSILYMIQAAKDMSEDFDLIESTFETLNIALQDIGDLRHRQFDKSNFLRRLTDILIAMVDFCSFSGRVFSEYSRKRLYIRALLKGRNKEIMAKCDHVQKVILLFRATLPIQILNVVEGMGEKIENLPTSFIQALQDMKIKSSDLQPLWGKASALEKIKETLKNSKDLDPDTEVRVETQMKLVRKHLVPGTFSWSETDPAYKSWATGHKNPFIFVSGEAGTGKTFFAYHCYLSIQEQSKRYRIANDKNNPDQRRTMLAAYFPFEPGRQESQSFRNVLAYILVQIADHDIKLCESIAKDLIASKIFKGGQNDKQEEKLKFLWNNLLVKKFEKTPETSRDVFILLDGVELMEESDRRRMLELFQTLNSDKCGIRILMTGTTDDSLYDTVFGFTKCPKIDLIAKTKAGGDFERIIEARINGSEVLKSFKDSTRSAIERKLLQNPSRVMSSVDLTLTMMEQSEGDETSALAKIDNVNSQEGLYTAMIEIVRAKRSEMDRRIVETIFALCTYAKQPLTVYDLQEIIDQEPSFGSFNVAGEIEGTLSSLLYTINYQPVDAQTSAVAKEGQPEGPITEAARLEKKISESKQQQVLFRQPAFRDYLEQSVNNMIPDPIESRVFFFLKLGGILCDRDPQGANLRKALQEYAAQWFLQHLKDISVKHTTPKQGLQIVEALARILTNENDVCRVFEELRQKQDDDNADVDFDLYDMSTDLDKSGGYNLKVLMAWARKMSFHDEEGLSPRAKAWVEKIIMQPGSVLEQLAQGHIESWTEKVTYNEAKIPYKFICRALWPTGNFPEGDNNTHWYFPYVLAPRARHILEYGKAEMFTTPVKTARCRIAAGLVLHSIADSEEKDLAAEFYQTNLDDKTTPGPERFYSYLGLAEYHRSKQDQAESMDEEEIREGWKRVVKYADLALTARTEEKGALGSELSDERCTNAFLLKAHALQELGENEQAIETCEEALREGLEYTQQLLELLTSIVNIHGKKGEWSKVIDAVRRQQPKIRSEWLWFRSTDFTNKKDLFRRAAVETRRVDYLLQTFQDSVDYWQKLDPARAQATQFELAFIYRRDARATKMAEHILDNMLATLTESQIAILLMSSIFPEMVDIQHENFTVTRSATVRAESITKLERLISTYERAPILESIQLAEAFLVLGKMHREVGNLGKARLHADRAFNICIADLEDSIGSNDVYAFRLLAKVLMFLDLDVDAQVALSLQMSVVDRSYDDYANANFNSTEQPAEPEVVQGDGEPNTEVANGAECQPQADSSETGKEANEPSADSTLTNVVSESQGSDGNETSATSLPSEQAEAADTDAKVSSLTVAPITQKNGESPAVNGQSTSEVSGVNGHTTDQPESTSAAPLTDGSSTKPTQPEIPDISASQDTIDITNGITCNGPCMDPPFEMKTFGPKGPKMYFCLDCATVDFCEDCYRKQIAFYDETGEGFWFKCCWARHRYLPQPIDDWMGVKDGVIRIGRKEKLWKDWMMSVRDRWKRKINEV